MIQAISKNSTKYLLQHPGIDVLSRASSQGTPQSKVILSSPNLTEEESRIPGRMITLLWFKLTEWLRLDMAINCKYVLSQFLVQLLSCILLFATTWTAALEVFLSITNSRSLLRLMPIESVMPSNHLILCHPLLLLPSIFPRNRVFSNESALCSSWPKYCSFSFSMSPSNEYSGLISFRMDWLDLFAVQWTLKSLLQYHSLKASTLQHSGFFIVQLSHPYMNTGKNHSFD